MSRLRVALAMARPLLRFLALPALVAASLLVGAHTVPPGASPAVAIARTLLPLALFLTTGAVFYLATGAIYAAADAHHRRRCRQGRHTPGPVETTPDGPLWLVPDGMGSPVPWTSQRQRETQRCAHCPTVLAEAVWGFDDDTLRILFHATPMTTGDQTP